MLATEAIQATPRGPDAHDHPYQRGAARKAVEPLFMMNNKIWNFQFFGNCIMVTLKGHNKNCRNSKNFFILSYGPESTVLSCLCGSE